MGVHNVRFRFLWGVICVFIWFNIDAQQLLQVERISSDRGLSQNVIFDILQDSEGFLWFATKDGLNRYDGYNFKVFTNDPNNPWSISGNTVVKLFEDSAGRIWVASDNEGLNIYDKKTGRFHHISHDPQDPASLSGSFVSGIVEDTSGYFVVAITGREINMFKLDEDFFENQTYPNIIRIPMPPQISADKTSSKDLRGIVKDAKQRIWVGGDNAIYRLNVQKAELKLSIDGYSFETAIANPDGSIWAGGGAHTVIHWDGAKATELLKGFFGVNGMRLDAHQNLWISRVDTLFGYNLKGWNPNELIDPSNDRCFYKWHPTKITNDYPLKSLTIDQSGIMWSGTNGYGIFKINPNALLFNHRVPGISIRQITPLSESDFYLKEYNGAWFKKSGTPIGMDPLRKFGKSQSCDFMLVTKSKEYWTRHYFGGSKFELRRYNPATKKSQRYKIGWHHFDSQPMIEDRNGYLWMAGANEILVSIDPINGEQITYSLKNGHKKDDAKIVKQSFSKEHATALYEDFDGILWVGSKRGIIKCLLPALRGNELKLSKYKNIIDEPQSLSYNHVTCFLDDPVNPHRYLWVCTKGGGINLLDKELGTFQRYSKKDGLPDNVVYGMLSDDDGNLWGSTNKGIFCKLAKNDSTENETDEDRAYYLFRNFSKSDGLQENEFNIGAYAKLADARLVFGGTNGYNIFNPKDILTADFNPPAFISKILVNNQIVSPGDETGILKNTIEKTQDITLTYLQDILTLEFVSLDFSAPEQNKYRYQLVGADDSWVEAGNHRSATFLHLQPNDYTFRVQGSNSQGVWSDKIAELHIHVLPPWWKTWWAYLIYVTLLITAIWTFFRFSVNRAKLRQQLAFEKREVDRVRELDALKTKLYTNMTHEFRTPLTIILGMAQQIRTHPKEHLQSGLSLILRNGQSLLDLINKMLNLSKLESGKMILDLVQGDVVLFLRTIVESFQSFAANKEIQLHFLPEVDSVMMDFDADKLQQVVSNLISNAFKFSPEGGHIYFSLRRDADVLTIRVKDTGHGIPKKDLENVFNRFYQVDDSITRQYEGSGIGLSLSKELVKLMRGEISVQSPPIGAKKGAEFIVVLPITQKEAIKIDSDVTAIEMQPSQAKPLTTLAKKEAVNFTNESQIVVNQSIENEESLHILLVEDNADVAAYVASCLPNYRLAIAENGREGLEIAIEMIPDLIISDVMMPVMDGFELCRRLKLDERTNHIPIIMLTARADQESKLEGLEFGANAYLPKPFDQQELLLNIKNLFALRNKLRSHYKSIAGLSESGELHESASKISNPEDAFVVKVKEIIETHLEDVDFSVDQLAKNLHLSHSQFGRKLHALTGLSPNRLIRFMRLKKANELLKSSDLSIGVIAYECGFNDPSYFSRVFKKEYGKTPIAWREQTTP